MQIKLLQKAARAGIVVLLATAVPVLAWSGPLVGPPGCTSGNPGCDAPINTGATSQTKTGQFVLSLPGSFNTWALSVSGAQYGIYSANSAGYFTQLDNSSWGVYTNGNTYAGGAITAGSNVSAGGNVIAAGNVYSGNGASTFASNGDILMQYSNQYLSGVLGWNGSTYTRLLTPNGDSYMAYSGQYLSSVLGWNGSNYTKVVNSFGGGYDVYRGGPFIANAETGGYTCPAGTTARLFAQADLDSTFGGSTMYLCEN